MKSIQGFTRISVSLAAALAASTSFAQQDLDKVEISTTQLADSIYMLQGAGGNIGVSVGEDGVFIIDDQFAPLSAKITAAIGELSDQPVAWVLNTHWHGDHTGGNEYFGKTGAVIVAHDNVRERMSSEQFMKAFGREVPASPDAALPVVTFSNDVSFHINGETIAGVHVPAAHTDGDTIVHFSGSDVLHLGDTFFNGFFPFIDQSSGGSIDGVMAAADAALALAGDDTKIIPGHGKLATRDDLVAYREMLQQVKTAMAPMLDKNMSRDEVITANPLGALSEAWGGGFMKTEVFTGIVFDIMSEG